jgi:hypothetical protein
MKMKLFATLFLAACVSVLGLTTATSNNGSDNSARARSF